VLTFTSGLPGGYRNTNGNFNNIGNNGNFWSSSENSTTNAWNRNLHPVK
jgi:RNA-directed DNA polymerase